jgi:3-hydroxy-9,10-secoandrosta-1,3,5(10)-triene-9,17-dione monooxygenase reductase component
MRGRIIIGVVREPSGRSGGAGAEPLLIPGAGHETLAPELCAIVHHGGNHGLPAPGYVYAASVRSESDPERFREVFGRFATGVAVITSSGSAGRGGLTANALCSLSLEPLLVLVCVENSARTLPILREAGRFAVNVLTADQEQIAAVFASKLPEAEKLDVVEHRFELGLPIIEDSLAWAVCDLRELLPGGDHTIVIGEVGALGLGSGEPLVWYGGTYHEATFRRKRRVGEHVGSVVADAK